MLVNVHKLTPWLIIVFLPLYSVQAQIWTLEMCIQEAQKQNKNLQISRNHSIIGEQKAKEAKAQLIPKITANADYRYFTDLPYQLLPISALNPTAPKGEFREAQFGVPHNINAQIQLSFPIYNAQIYGAIQTTKIGSELTKLQHLKMEEQIYFEISNLYYNAQILHHQSKIIDSNLVNSQKLLENIQLLFDKEMVKGSDVRKIGLQLAQLMTQKENIKVQYEQVLNTLKFMIGQPIDEKIFIDTIIESPPTVEYPLSSTLDMKINQLQNELLKNELGTLKKTKFLPSLQMVATYGTSGFGYDGEPKSFLNFYPIGFVGAQLNYPLFNGTVTQRKIAQKSLEIQNNEWQNDIIKEQNTLQISNITQLKNLYIQSMEDNQSQVNLAQNIYTQTVLQQKLGIATLTEVLLADTALREAQQQYLRSIIDFLKADLELKKWTGNFIYSK